MIRYFSICDLTNVVIPTQNKKKTIQEQQRHEHHQQQHSGKSNGNRTVSCQIFIVYDKIYIEVKKSSQSGQSSEKVQIQKEELQQQEQKQN